MRKNYWLVLLCAFSIELNAQTWIKTNGPYGGSIRDIIVRSNGTIYALGDYPNQSIFRSADGGNNWTSETPLVMGNDAYRIADLNVANDGTVYALAYSNLYKTVDDGITWVKVNTVSGSSSGGFDSGDEIGINILSNTLYVMGYHSNDGQPTVFRSTNGGSTWTKGYQGKSFTHFVSNSLGEVYALASGQTWKSSNDGTVFTQLAAPVPSDIISGANFLTAKSDGSQLAIVTGSSNIYTLTAPFSSAVWTAVTETNIAEPASYGFSAKLLYSADKSTLFLFDDYNNKVYSRTTGNWTTPLTTSFITSNGEDLSCAASLDANTLYVGAQTIGVYKTINGGVGWTEVNTGIENLSMNNLVVANDGSIIAGGDLVYRSADNGQSWSRISTAGTGYTVIKSITSNTLLLLGEYGNTSYKSVNSGVDWNPIATSTPSANRFTSPDGTKILAYSFNKLYYSADEGANWSAALTISGLPATINFANFSEGQSVVMDQNANIFAYMYDSSTGTYKMFKIVPNSTTTPTTATATEISLATIGVTYVRDMKFLNNKIYVLGYGNTNNYISSTADAGTSWIQKVTSATDRLDVDVRNNYLFVTESNSSNYVIYLSRDDGSNFVSSNVDVPSNTTPYGISVAPDGVAYTGYSGSSVYKTNATVVIPSAPSNLVSLGSGTDRIMLACEDNEPISHYIVIEKFNGTDYDTLLKTGVMSSPGKIAEEVKGLEPNTSYQFRVYAHNAAGSSAPLSITVNTLEACASTLPDNRSWSGNVNGTTTLTNVSIKAITAGVYSISDVNNGTTPTGDVNMNGTFSIGCASTTAKTYLYPDYPIVPNSNGTWTSGTNTLVLKWITEPGVTPEVAATVTLVENASDPTPAAPANPAAYIYGDNSIEVNWLAVAFEKTFTVERKTGAGGTYAVVGTVSYPTTNFIDPGPFTANTTYFYRIKSENGNAVPGVSPYSAEAQVTFKIPNFVLAETNVNSTPTHTFGTVWADFDKDGFDDLMLTKFDLFTGSQSTPLIFQNDGIGNFSLAATNLEATSYANGTTADYDNDGDIDLFYTAFGDLNRLYSGNGNFMFSKVSPTPVEGENPEEFEGAPFSAAWVDYNKDGLLDLFIGRNGSYKSEIYTQNVDHTFTKTTNAGELVSSVFGTFGMAWADYDNDGDMDVFIADSESGQPDKLFRNNNDGTFTKVTGSAFDGDAAKNSQSSSWADFDNDQDFDLFVGDESGLNSLFRNNGNGTFTKLTAAAFDVTTGGALGSNWVDVNNDGFIDLLVTGQTGNVLFINSNGTLFTRNTVEKIADTRLYCISASSSDYNNDGFMDIALSRTFLGESEGELGPAQNTLLFKNNNKIGNWLKVKLTGATSNKSGIGAKIRATTGSVNQIRQVSSHIDIGSQNSLTQHFGLGSANTVNVTVTWPSGTVQTLTNVTANTTVNITEDGTGPVITSRTPGLSATEVSAATAITITLNEASTSVSGKKLNIALASNPGTILQSVDVTNASVSGNTYTFTLPTRLQTGSNYTVTIDAGAFKDVYGNAFLGVTSDTWNFQTASAPAITGLVPAHNSNNVSALTNLSLTFDKAITAAGGKLIKVYKSTDLVTPVLTIDASSGSIAANTVTFASSEKLQRATTYNVSVDAGAFNDGNGTDFPGLSSSSWVFTTDPGPSYTVLPSHNAIDVPVGSSLQITFSEGVSATALKMIRIMDGATVISQGDVSVVGSLASNVYTYPAPNGGWPYSKVLKVTLDQGSFTDADGNDSAPVVSDTWNFTTAAQDITPPTIDAQSLPTSIAKGFGTTSPSFTVTDDRGVNSVVVHIRKISGSDYSDITPTAGTTLNSYVASISEATDFDAIGTEFFITASDAAGNIARYPADPETHRVDLSYSAIQASIPSTSIGFGGAKTGWKVFSIPFELTGANSNVSSIFEELAGKDNRKDYRLITLKNDQEWSEYPDDFAAINRGTGYFINIRTDPGAIDLFDGLQAPDNSRSNLYQMSLKTGWNMIGNPYLTPISWDDVAQLNGLSGTEAQLKTYTQTGYSNDQILGPYEGGFVLMSAAKTISIPFQGQTSSGGRQGVRTLGEDISAEAWAIPFTINQGELSYTLGGIGMAPDAEVSIDNYDDVTPPRFIDYLELNFNHPEHIARNFTREIVPTQQKYTWEFIVDSNLEGMAELNWSNAPLVRSGKDIFLLDVAAQHLVNMKETGVYSFDPKESSRFRIYYGDNLNIAPERVQLGKAYPNPTAGYTSIPFSLPETGGLNQSVTLQIMDAMGRPLGTIKEGQYNPGYYEAAFDARELMNGFYTYSLTVKNRKGQTIEVNKLIVK